MNYKTYVQCFRFNGNSTEMREEGALRVFKRQLDMPADADAFIIRQVQISGGTSNDVENYTLMTNMTGKDLELATCTFGVSECPGTFFSEPVKKGTYDFTIRDTYEAESNYKSTIAKLFDNEFVIVIEFVMYDKKKN